MSVNPVATLDRHFEVFDTAARGGSTDGKISREDLEAVANGSQYTTEQREAARQILENDVLHAQLDTARQGGGVYTADGIISRDDVDAVLADAPLYEETSTFHSDHSTLAENAERGAGPDASPMAAAVQVEMLARDSGSGPGSATSQFMALVEEHADDTGWLQEFFGALGAERTAAYLSDVANPGSYGEYWSADQIDARIETVSGVLQSMYQGGQLNDADIGRLVEHWAMEGGDFNTGIAQLFGDLQGPRSQDMQNAFFRAATELGLAGHDISSREFTFSDDAIDRLSDGDRESLSAAGAYVLAQTGSENQVSRLIELQTDGGDDALGRFIALAMDNPSSVPGFDAFSGDARQDLTSTREVDYDGVAQLVQTLSWDTTYRGGPDRALPPSPYSYATLQEVRDTVFYAAANGLDANVDQWGGNTVLKDGLARILTADYDRMIGDASTPNGARLDDDHPLPAALENFAEHVLFTQPTGHARDQASEFLIDRLSTTIDDINSLSDAAFMDKYGANQAQMAHITGSVLGHINNGMEGAVESATDARAARQEALEFGLNLAWAVGQDGLKLLPGGNVVSTILPDSITDSNTFGTISGEVESKLREGLTEEASQLLLEEFPDLKPDEALTGLARELSEVVEVGNERDFLASFLSSYTDVDSNPAAR